MTIVDDLPHLIETDARGRTTLPGGKRRYILHAQPDGALILEPAVVISEAERAFLANTGLQERIAHLDAHPEEFVRDDYRRTRRAEQTS